MFKTRLISGICLVIALIALCGIGGNLLLVSTAIISLIGLSEIYKILGIERKLLGYVGYFGVVAYYAMILCSVLDYLGLFVILCMVAIMSVYVFAYPTYRSEHIMLAFFGIFYVAVMLSYVYQTRALPDGHILVWLIFLSSWGCDTCAYCAGMLFGKHKMAPVLSPKKSIEGAVGGFIGAGLLGALFALAANHFMGGSANPMIFALICSVGGLISMVGDLCASAIKRNHEIKDYGRLIPGHGGILDRFDSVIFTAPIIFYLGLFLL